MTGIYVVSGAVTIASQMKVTAWCRTRWGPARSLSRGLLVLGAAFVPMVAADSLLLVWPDIGLGLATVAGIVALLLTAALLALGTAVVLPFEMDTIVALSRGRLVATHYGFYNTVCGVGILLGNAGTGWAVDLARSAGLAPIPWAVLVVLGVLCAAALSVLYRRALLTGAKDAEAQAADDPSTVRLRAIGGHGATDDGTPTRPLPTLGPSTIGDARARTRTGARR